MVLTDHERRVMGKRVADRVCNKYGIQVRRIEKKEDFYEKNLIATLRPSKKIIEVKSKYDRVI